MDKKNLIKGQPIYCMKCRAAINSFCQMKDISKTEVQWNCAFCSNQNLSGVEAKF